MPISPFRYCLLYPISYVHTLADWFAVDIVSSVYSLLPHSHSRNIDHERQVLQINFLSIPTYTDERKDSAVCWEGAKFIRQQAFKSVVYV